MSEKRFFCLRGFMKSGTNWLGGLLNTHPDISVNGEFHLHRLVEQMNTNFKTVPLYSKGDNQKNAKQYLETLIRNCMIDAADPTATVIGDRTPHSIIPVTLRGVPHISIIRDGRDVLVSRLFHLYNYPEVTGLFGRQREMAENLAEFKKDPWFFAKQPHRLLNSKDMIVDSITWWRDHLRRDASIQSTYPNLKVAFVKYEDLHNDVTLERKRLFEFLGVDPELAQPLNDKLKPGIEVEAPEKFNRKGAVGDWKNYFHDDVKSWFKDIAGESLIEHGYEDSSNW